MFQWLCYLTGFSPLGAALVCTPIRSDWVIGQLFHFTGYCVPLLQLPTNGSSLLGMQMLPIVDIAQSIGSSFWIFHPFVDGTQRIGSDWSLVFLRGFCQNRM
jgi:hypothetical protein